MAIYGAVNEDFLADVPAKNVIPNHVLTFSEAAMYVNEAIEHDFNSLFESIGVNELAVYESTGSMIVYEGTALANFKDEVVKFFQGLWGKIKDFFERVLAFFEEQRKKSVADLGKLTAKDVDMIADDAKLGKVHQFTIDDKTFHTKNAKAQVDIIKSAFNILSGDDVAVKAKEEADKQKEKIYGIISGDSANKNSKDMLESIEKAMVGEQIEITKQWLASNIHFLTGVVLEGNSKKEIKKAYADTRDLINKCIKEVKGYKDERAKVAPHEISVLKLLGSTLNTANGKVMDICKRRYAEYKAVLMRVKKAVKAGGGTSKETGVAAENASYSYHQEDLIKEAFDW